MTAIRDVRFVTCAMVGFLVEVCDFRSETNSRRCPRGSGVFYCIAFAPHTGCIDLLVHGTTGVFFATTYGAERKFVWVVSSGQLV